MDLVNSVTQNSNNHNVTMENRDANHGNDGNGSNGDGGNKKSINNNSNQTPTSSVPTTMTTTIAPSSSMSSATDGHMESSKNQVPDYLKAIGMDPRKFWPKKYRFTREKSPGQYNPLTIAQRNFYETNGYIIIEECAPKKLVESIKSQHKEQSLVNEFLIDKLIARNGKLLQYVKCFCDERIMLMTHQLVDSFQAPQVARDVIDNKLIQRQQLFRDWIYLPFRPIDKVVCAVTAIESLEHCILVVPGTHRVGQCNISSTLDNISAAYDSSQERLPQSRELFESSPEKLSELVEKSKKGFKYVNLKAGQTLFYHPGLVHGFCEDLVNFNKSQLALFAYYAAADCEYIDLRRSPELMGDKQTVPLSLAHFGDKNPSDYRSWMGRPKLLKDVRASL